MDVHVSHLFSEVIAEDSIAVAEQGARQLVEKEGGGGDSAKVILCVLSDSGK